MGRAAARPTRPLSGCPPPSRPPLSPRPMARTLRGLREGVGKRPLRARGDPVRNGPALAQLLAARSPKKRRTPAKAGGRSSGRPSRRRGSANCTSAAKPAVRAQASAMAMPSTSRPPKPRTIGTGDESSNRKPTPVARPAVAIVGPPTAAARSTAASGDGPSRRPANLVVASLELDRVVHSEADQHGQHGDRGHRQVTANQRQGAERHRGRRQGQCQRKQPQAGPEDERERGGHHQQRRHEQHEDRAPNGVREPLDHHRHPGEDQVGAVGVPLPVEHDPLVRHRLAEELDRPLALGVGQVGPQPDLDQRRVAAREEVGEARLGLRGRPIGARACCCRRRASRRTRGCRPTGSQ